MNRLALVALVAAALAMPRLAAEDAPAPPAPIRLTLAAGQRTLEHESPIAAGRPVELVLAPVPDEVLEVRVAAPEGEVEMSVYRDRSAEPETGTEPGSGAVGWIGAAGGARELRFVVRASATASRFRLSILVRPDEPPAD